MDRETRIELLTWVVALFTVIGVLLVVFPKLPSKLGEGLQAGIGLGTLALAAGAYEFRRNLNLPDFTRLEVRKVLTIADIEGKDATIVRSQTERANKRRSSYTFMLTNVSADGSIVEMSIDGDEVKDYEKVLSCGTWKVTRTTQRFYRKGEIIPREFKCKLVNSYPKKVENSMLAIPVKTEKIYIEVNLPEKRPCVSRRAYLAFHDQPQAPMPEPILSAGKRKISMEIRKPRLGADYHLEWNW